MFSENVAWEYLWALEKQTIKKLDGLFKDYDNCSPSKLVHSLEGMFPNEELLENIESCLNPKNHLDFLNQTDEAYPNQLLDAKYPLRGFYYRGESELTKRKCVSIIGSRDCSEDGKKRTRQIVQLLLNEGYTVVSGLASGIDTTALSEAIKCDGKVIGVIGTTIDKSYPKENTALQEEIANNHLLISQFPYYKATIEHPLAKKQNFVERNKTMSALSLATIVIEAKDKSGTLTQAKACLEQNRKLFILNSCFSEGDWASKFEAKGAIRLSEFQDFLKNIEV